MPTSDSGLSNAMLPAQPARAETTMSSNPPKVSTDNMHGSTQQSAISSPERQTEALLRNFSVQISALLPVDDAETFAITTNLLTLLGDRKPEALQGYRERILDLVSRNEQIVTLYNEYAAMHAEGETRPTHRLPRYVRLETAEHGMLDHTLEKDPLSEADEDVVESNLHIGEADSNSPLRGGAHLCGVHDMDDLQQPDPKPYYLAPCPGDSGNVQQHQIIDVNAIVERADNLQQGGSKHPAQRTGTPVLEMIHPIASNQNIQAPAHIPPHIAAVSRPQFMGIECDEHSVGGCILEPIQNPAEFPTGRIQEVQAQYYPSTKIVTMWTHQIGQGHVVQATADVAHGPVNHLIINDKRLIAALGLLKDHHNVIALQLSELRTDETFKIRILPGQKVRKPEQWLVGELISARHPYLDWLALRGVARPKLPPLIGEARILASRTNRRAPDVLREVKKQWDLEQGSGGRKHSENRKKTLGDDFLDEESVEKVIQRSMWE
ncbi:hypothetical protein ACN47E_000150 [Coniothyrium glycines]